MLLHENPWIGVTIRVQYPRRGVQGRLLGTYVSGVAFTGEEWVYCLNPKHRLDSQVVRESYHTESRDVMLLVPFIFSGQVP